MEDARRDLNLLMSRFAEGKSVPDFRALVRLLETLSPDKPRYGYAKTPADENLRFDQPPYLHFPPAELAGLEQGDKAGVDARVSAYFFGLLGVNGPMPLDFTGYVWRRSYTFHDNTWRHFLDIINHRFLMLFYRAFAQNEQAVSSDRKESDAIGGIVKSLAGYGTGFEKGSSKEKLSLVFARQLGSSVKSRENLEDMLRQLFKCPLKVRDFIPSRVDIPAGERALLGRNSSLGLNTQIGRSTMSLCHSFEIDIGPISFDEYLKFISGMVGMNLLIDAVELALDRPLDYCVVFEMKTFTIPMSHLGFNWEDEEEGDAAQLGYTCWLGALNEDAAILRIEAGRLGRERHRKENR